MLLTVVACAQTLPAGNRAVMIASAETRKAQLTWDRTNFMLAGVDQIDGARKKLWLMRSLGETEMQFEHETQYPSRHIVADFANEMPLKQAWLPRTKLSGMRVPKKLMV